MPASPRPASTRPPMALLYHLYYGVSSPIERIHYVILHITYYIMVSVDKNVVNRDHSILLKTGWFCYIRGPNSPFGRVQIVRYQCLGSVRSEFIGCAHVLGRGLVLALENEEYPKTRAKNFCICAYFLVLILAPGSGVLVLESRIFSFPFSWICSLIWISFSTRARVEDRVQKLHVTSMRRGAV